MEKNRKHVVFDVVGTLVSYSHLFEALEHRLGQKLRHHSISPQLLGFAWLEHAEREYTYLSLSGHYVEFANVFKSVFFRVLHFAGVPEPREIATEEDVEYLRLEYRNCFARPGAKECIDNLKASGWTVWAFTSGDAERVKGYFEKGGLSIEEKNLITCDTIGVGKPDLKAYKSLKERMELEDGAILWYAAAHAWDVSAAGRAGFKTAYCTVLEKEPLPEIFGDMDISATTLPELAEKIKSVKI
ncbi:HAD-like protein [Corynespora cassiicola Philippines]|uniref:HAD-like protein n=1 Tax=Corynespora cassiicola Philippines TaxID=1448308 RepID=A0A2T2PCK8_CORCC|nr:HAD-like protein [Corynespora cassiicola Philippines]